jgi:hypothetical protein
MKQSLSRVPNQLRVLSGTAALAILAGCSGGGTGTAGSNLPQTASRNGSTTQSVARRMASLASVLPPGMQQRLLPPRIASPVAGFGQANPACPKANLAFISDAGTNQVFLANHVGECGNPLNGFNEPQGLAVDRLGNLWVANTGANNILKYAPPYNGAPVATLNDPGGYPADVCVDLNGNVAVTNIIDINGGPGNIVFYAAGAVNPTGAASGATFTSPRFCAYASNGNLAFDDADIFNTGVVNLGLVLKGNSNNMNAVINTLTITNGIGFPGGVQVPTHGGLAVLDQTGLVIDNYKNPKDFNLGAPISVTPLGGAGDPVQFQLYPGSKDALAADATNDQTEAYTYPAGGNPIFVYKFVGGVEPIGVGHFGTEQFTRKRSQTPDAGTLP